jgi:hypothetical protein
MRSARIVQGHRDKAGAAVWIPINGRPYFKGVPPAAPSAEWFDAMANSASDNPLPSQYSVLMAMARAHIIITLDTKEPIEIGNFVSAFTSISNQYSKFISENHPELSPEAKIFVREIEKGSIIADLIPFAPILGLDSIVPAMQQIDVVVEFIQMYGSKITHFFNSENGDIPPSSPVSSPDLKDFLGTVSAIAADPDGRSVLEAAYFEDGRREVRAALSFNANSCRASTAIYRMDWRRRAAQLIPNIVRDNFSARAVCVCCQPSRRREAGGHSSGSGSAACALVCSKN